MSATLVDTSYRSMSLETLEALRVSLLTQIKAVEGVGQTHSVSGRQTALPNFDSLFAKLANVESALAWKRNSANAGNNGFASRHSSFRSC